MTQNVHLMYDSKCSLNVRLKMFSSKNLMHKVTFITLARWILRVKKMSILHSHGQKLFNNLLFFIWYLFLCNFSIYLQSKPPFWISCEAKEIKFHLLNTHTHIFLVLGDTRCKPYSEPCTTASFTKNCIARMITLGQNRGHPLLMWEKERLLQRTLLWDKI